MDALEYLKAGRDDDAAARDLLAELCEPAVYPKEVARFVGLGLLYNAKVRRFELPRTPSLTIVSQFVYAAAGVQNLGNDASAGSFAGPQQTTPRDGYTWRIMAGLLSFTANAIVQVRQLGGGRPIVATATAANIATPFTIPGNGVELDEGKSIEAVVSAAGTLTLTLYISEERMVAKQNVMATTARMGRNRQSPPGSMDIP